MAIVFLQQKKFQKSLIFIVVAILVITLVVIWRGFFYKETPPKGEKIILTPEKKIEINFEVLDNPLLDKLQPFPKIQPFQEISPTEGGKVGRENPFIPY